MSGLLARLVAVRGDFRLDAELAVPTGGVLALLGRNGTGKSTALDAIAGLLPLASGRIAIGGTVVDDPATGVLLPPERRPVGLVQQQAPLFPHLTALENVAFGLRTAGSRRRAARERAAALLDEAGLGALAGRRPSALSGGQAARVALVRALARRPALLLLDEPLAAIDAERRPELRAAIAERLRSFSGSALVVTHDVRDAEALAGEVVVLDGGRVVQRGPLDALRAAPVSDAVARLLE